MGNSVKSKTKKSRPFKLFKDLLIIISISLAILIGSEAILRTSLPGKAAPTDVAYEFNEEFLIQLKPNISKVFTTSPENGGSVVRWKTNKDSFRGDDLKDDPGYRVIVYGDSNIQARFSEISKTYTAQLEHYLKKKGLTGVEVINAGVLGFGPDQSLIRFAKEADRYRPDLVIFHIFADNDYGDIVRNRLFSLDKSGNLINTEHRKTIDAHLLGREDDKNVSRVSRMQIVKAAKKMILGFLNKEKRKENLIHQLRERAYAEYLVYKESGPRRFSHFADHYDIDIALNPDQESSKMKIQLMNKVLKRANNLAHAKGIRFLVVIQPSIIDLTNDNSVLNYEYLRKYPRYKRTNLTGEVEKICEINKINFINLFKPFLENSPNDLYFRAGDNHWNDKGQKLAAKETARYIMREAMFEKK